MNMFARENNPKRKSTGNGGFRNAQPTRLSLAERMLARSSLVLRLVAGLFFVSGALAQPQTPGPGTSSVPTTGQTPVQTPTLTSTLTTTLPPGQPKSPASVKAASATTNPTLPSIAPGARPSEVGPTWKELTPLQQASLKPLAANWSGIGEAQKRKWLAVSKNYPALPAPEQAKLHSRMTEWASLSQQQRSQARLNFAETKKLSPGDQSANWQAYQALSPEDRQKLAAKASPKPAGAATAVKPVPEQKLAAVPAARPDTKHATSGALGIQGNPAVDRNTLLPRPAFADDPTVRKN